MKERLVNHQQEPRRLNALAKILLALFALLLTPTLAWAQTSYGITVKHNGTNYRVTSANASNVLGDGTVTYDVTNSVLTLDNASINGCIYFNGYDPDFSPETALEKVFNFKFKGTCFITATDSCAIKNTTTLSLDSNNENVYDDQVYSRPKGTINLNPTTEGGSLTMIPKGNPSVELFQNVNFSNGSGNVSSGVCAIYSQLFSEGTGADGNNPYILKTAADIKNFATLYNIAVGPETYVKLGNDIDCTGLTIETIGSNTVPYSAIFDGNGKTISNLTITPNPYNICGLFSHLHEEGIIQNLTLSNCTISGGQEVGAFVGYVMGGSISNCHTSGCTVSSGEGQTTHAGGIAGYAITSDGTITISGCTVTSGSVTARTEYDMSPGTSYAGGILGEGLTNTTTISISISGCEVNSTTITSNHTCNNSTLISGGIVGNATHTNGTFTISNNIVKGSSKITYLHSAETMTIKCGAIAGDCSDGVTFTDNTYEYSVITHDNTTGYANRGIGSSDEDVIGQVELAGTKAISVVQNPINGNNDGEYSGKDGTYYMENDGYLVVPGVAFTLEAIPNEGHKPRLTLSDTNIEVTTEEINNNAATPSYDHTEFTFTMPDADVTATLTFPFDITPYTVQQVDTIYTGSSMPIDMLTAEYSGSTIGLTNGTEFTVTSYGTELGEIAPTNVGQYTATIEGIGIFTGTKDVTYKINPKNLETATIEAIEDQIYTGEALTPEPQVSIVLNDGDEATVLVKDQDFTYSYEANTNISSETTPKVIVTGTGNYTGTAQKTFNIVESYNVWVAGTLITSGNAANVTGSSTARVIYDAATNTLTLNGAYIVTSNSAGIKSGLANLKVVLSGGQSEVKCTGEDYYAFESTTENATVTFSSSTTSEGYLDITTAGYNKFFKDITPAYDGITHFDQTSVYTNEYYYHIRKSPWTGNGTEDDPYLISTTTDLKTMSSYAYQGIVLNHYFKLNNDIDWSQETSAFNSIGRRYDNYRIYSFNGTFDGNNKTISNLTSENGMFNYVMNGGSIKNLTLTGCTVTGGSTGEDAAGLVADFRSSGKIENCSIKNSSITNNNYTNITSAGGIVGYMTNGTIDNCSIEDVTITMSGSPTYKQCAGGIVGHTYEGSTITNCEVKVNAGTTKITNTAETDQDLYAGAIVGWRERGKTLTGNTYQAGVVVETRQGNNPAVTKSGNTQRGLGDGDDIINSAELAGVKKITVTKNDKGTVEYVSGYYRVDGNDIYALPFTLSDELTVIKGTSAAGYDEPTIAIKTVTNNTDIDPETADGTSEGLYYAQWEFEMPNDNATATILFAINLAKASRNFVIADRDYTSEPLPVTEIKTTLDDLDASNPAFIELQSGTHFNVTGYKDSQDVAIGTDAPTNAGNYKVTIQGIGDCTGSVTLPFAINRLAITPELTVSDWIYGGYDVSENGPSLTDGSNPGNGTVTFYFKKEGENEFHTMEVSSTSDAGNYSVYATIAQSTNYEGAQTETKTFNITQLDISNATVTLDNTTLIYNGSVQTVNVTTVIVGDIEVPIDCYEVSGNTEKEAGDYKLTVTAKTMDSSGNPIKNNFTGSAEKDWKIKYRTVTADELGLSENQTYATYFNNTESFDLPDGIVAYIITGVSGTTVTTKRISYIPKNVAVLVENGTSTEDAVDAATDNQLLGTADAKDVSTITGGAVYVLYKSEFVKTTTGTIPANRCYLVVSGGAGARSLSISHGEGNDTGIDNLVFDEDGTEKWYDLRGRRIEKPTKAGLYIRNGEKIVVNDNNK